MKFDHHLPTAQLRPYIKSLVVSEQAFANEYKVFPSPGLVMGFQYRGQLATIHDQTLHNLASAGITGITDGFQVFKSSAAIGTILVYFTEVGFAHFATPPAHALFNLSSPLEDIFDKTRVAEVEEKLSAASDDRQRIRVVEQFLLSQLKDIQTDRLVVEAVRRIYQTQGRIRIKELSQTLCISQSPFEKRFRKVVGTSAKKFASIVRFHAVLHDLQTTKSLAEICYEHNFFDQAHFIKDFKQFTGDTPDHFKRHT